MDAQGFSQWIQQKRTQLPTKDTLQASVGNAKSELVNQMREAQLVPPPRPTFDPSQGMPAGMGSMGGKPGQFGNSVPGTVGPQYGAGGAPPGRPFTPQASSGNIFAAPERGGQNANSSQPMGVRNAPNLFGKGPTAPRGPGPAAPPSNGWSGKFTAPPSFAASGLSAPPPTQGPRAQMPNLNPAANSVGIGGVPIPTNVPIQGPKKVGG